MLSTIFVLKHVKAQHCTTSRSPTCHLSPGLDLKQDDDLSGSHAFMITTSTNARPSTAVCHEELSLRTIDMDFQTSQRFGRTTVSGDQRPLLSSVVLDRNELPCSGGEGEGKQAVTDGTTSLLVGS